jgi:hypothetical protein
MSGRVAALAALLVSCASSGAHAAPESAPLTSADRKEFHEAVISSPTMRSLMEADPAGFKAFEDGVLNDLAAGKIDENGARKRGYDFAVNARAKMLISVNQAPDDDYLAYIGAQLSAMKTFSQYNTRACYEFIEDNGISEDTAATFGPALAVEVEKIGQAQAVAAKAGAKTPVKRQPSTDKDTEAAVQTYVDLGGDPDWLKAMGDKTTDKLTPERRCAGAIKWVEAILALPKTTAVQLLTGQ